ncbi:glycosyl transferase [Obba rivulosa]|uniref:Glycosyl transferase n=1 Tax=Obba rivulosa TaxID=1052685 RepID=A0A8E2AN61_9APHY|nr:glycosyl transferase [Obba rivulosa]
MEDTTDKGTADAGYLFTLTQDWFSFNVDNWRNLFPLIKATEPRVLEIGSWEGRSAVFLLTELCNKGGEIICIDHFDLLKTEAGRERYRKITHNLSCTEKRFRVLDEFSVPALMTVLREEMSSTNPGFDWIYVDGSHEADDTFLDGELVWRVARKGAVVIFDDYHWDREPEDSIHHPKRGIDAFMALHAGEYNVISKPEQYQVILQKTSEMRIGFLVKEKADRGLDEALGYGVHIALTIDSAYAMPAAVAIRSAVIHTEGRISFYVVDLGLTDDDKSRIRRSLPERADITILFLSPPEDGFSAEHGSTWAKVDMLRVLPVERVLYLDADVLVRASVRELWETDLCGNPVAAAQDVGFPMGHRGIQGAPYFNAGVLLMNLALIREDAAGLQERCRGMKEAEFHDQDALNAHFAGRWLPLNLKWNAQGLGTYADCASSEREKMDLNAMCDPAIVHFTGPVNPDVAHVLNPYVQPYTAKPWGYAGAPGHPFTDEWWSVVDATAWSGWRRSQERSTYRCTHRDLAVRTATEMFGRVVEDNEYA